MASRTSQMPFPCRRCARLMRKPRLPTKPTSFFARLRHYSHSSANSKDPTNDDGPERPAQDAKHAEQAEQSAMTRRLEEATEDALLSGGRAGRRALDEAGFSAELKERLFNKIADAQFRAENPVAFQEAGMAGKLPDAAGEGTRNVAASQPWTGEESTADTVLRMLDDAHKSLRPGLRGKPRIPDPVMVDLRLRREPAVSAGTKVASARERASAYAAMGMKELEKGLSEEEKEAMKKEFRDRFRPAARALPNTISGLAAMANERIEDAIARGQFKNIPRGKNVERDPRADNPFIDTTEYIMNKMIKRQEIVPPWIEKQQELVKAARVFRARLRADWKRHVARMISSRGGSLQEQMVCAEDYARAEEIHNPRRRNSDQVSIPTNATDDPVMAKLRQQAREAPSRSSAPATGEVNVLTPPFRDPDWVATERSYMELAVTNLNAITRSYNLMAPDLAKKPYFNLQRELDACYADVAPEIAATIKERAAQPPKSLLNSGGQHSSILDRFGGKGQTVKVHESKAPHYGLKEFWRDWWTRPR